MKRTIQSIFLVVLGSFLFSIAVNSIIIPNQMGQGGVTGIALLLLYTLKIQPSITNLIVNTLIVLVGWKFLDRKTIYYTILAIVSMSFFMQIVHIGTFIPENTVLVPIAAGIIVGLAIGIVIYGGGSTAGTDILALIINKFFGVSVSMSLMILDVLIVTPLTFIIGLEKVILTLISIYISSTVITFLLEGLNIKRAFMIISNQSDEIAEEIMLKINRGVTVLQGHGYYSKNEKKVLYIVVNRFQILPTQKIIYDKDPKAFVTISEVQQVLGEGFSIIEEHPAQDTITEEQLAQMESKKN